MSLIRRETAKLWDPFKELEDMSARLNRFFMRPLGTSQEALTAFDWAPSINVSEVPNAYVVKAELPGVKKEDISVQLEQGVLTVTGERKQEKEHKDEKMHRMESSYGSFMRSFSLPEDAGRESIEANYRDGMLTVRIPKVPGEKKPEARRIAVG
jgi:HSP20 family protein